MGRPTTQTVVGRRGRLLGLTLGVLAAHAVLLVTWPRLDAVSQVAPVTLVGRVSAPESVPVRHIYAADPVASVAEAGPQKPGTDARPSGHSPTGPNLPGASPALSSVASVNPAQQLAQPMSTLRDHTETDAKAADALAAAEAAEAGEGPDGVEGPPLQALPTYPTRIPQAFEWAFSLRRGAVKGEAWLSWQPQSNASGYALQLRAQTGRQPLLTWTSRGRLDEAGIAPDQFTVQRRSRSVELARFDREAGRLQLHRAAPATAPWPVLPGMQDRLSWMVQLPAVVAADPVRMGRVGAQVQLAVSGTRGAGVWTFENVGEEDLETAKGRRRAHHWVREPFGPHQTRAEAWLDSDGSYQPLQLRLWHPGAPALELTRTDAP